MARLWWGILDLGCKLDPPQGDCGSSRITRTSSRHRTEVSNCWTLSSLPPPFCTAPGQVSCSHTLPSSSRHLTRQASPCSVRPAFWAMRVLQRMWAECGCFHFSPQRLPGTWGHSEGNSQCPALARDTFANPSGF